ncbi:hypothetical protein CYMTET_53021, partial [Cymbomonas tetramitiformis]
MKRPAPPTANAKSRRRKSTLQHEGSQIPSSDTTGRQQQTLKSFFLKSSLDCTPPTPRSLPATRSTCASDTNVRVPPDRAQVTEQFLKQSRPKSLPSWGALIDQVQAQQGDLQASLPEVRSRLAYGMRHAGVFKADTRHPGVGTSGTVDGIRYSGWGRPPWASGDGTGASSATTDERNVETKTRQNIPCSNFVQVLNAALQ